MPLSSSSISLSPRQLSSQRPLPSLSSPLTSYAPQGLLPQAQASLPSLLTELPSNTAAPQFNDFTTFAIQNQHNTAINNNNDSIADVDSKSNVFNSFALNGFNNFGITQHNSINHNTMNAINNDGSTIESKSSVFSGFGIDSNLNNFTVESNGLLSISNLSSNNNNNNSGNNRNGNGSVCGTDLRGLCGMSPYMEFTKDYGMGTSAFPGGFAFTAAAAATEKTEVAGNGKAILMGNTFLNHNINGMNGMNGVNACSGNGGVICQSNRESPSFFNLADEPVPYDDSESLLSEVCYGNEDEDEEVVYGGGFELFDGSNQQQQ